MRKMAWALVVLVSFAACGGSDEDPAPRGPDVDVNGTWILESGRSASGDVPLVEEFPVTLEIDGGDVRGIAACNSYGGGVGVTGSEFDMGHLVVTERGCAPRVTRSQELYLEALEAVDEVARDGETLTLTGPDAELEFRVAPQVETEALVGTTWVLTTLTGGTAGDDAASSAAPARLRLDSSGKFTGTTGCRSFSGDWVASDARIVFTNMAFEGSCSGRATAQDGHVIAVLGAGFSAAVEGRQLILTATRGGLGLVYDAR